MKNLLKSLCAFALLVTLSVSCDTDPCKNVVCGTAGTCTEGVCVCDAGYEQDSTNQCNTLMRTKFIKGWVANDICSASGTASYSVVASAGAGGNTEIAITNFWGVFTNQVMATVDGNTITIARQEPDNDSFFVQGSGTYSNGMITWSYDISDETDPQNIATDNCTSTWN